MNQSSCNSTVQRQLLPHIYGVEMCVILLGNILALYLLVTKNRKKNIDIVFSYSLVISDTFYALTLPFLIIYYSKGLWDFGGTVCKMERFLFSVNLYGSIYLIMCISVFRYLAIVHPFFTLEHIRLKHSKIISVFLWIFVAAISSPVFYCSGVTQGRCSLFLEPVQNFEKVTFSVLMAVIGCLLPFVVTFGSYFGVIWAVVKNANITFLEKNTVALTVGLVCILYAVSFVPYHSLQIWYFKLKAEGSTNYYVCNLYSMSKALVCLNMCFHPILHIVLFESVSCCR